MGRPVGALRFGVSGAAGGADVFGGVATTEVVVLVGAGEVAEVVGTVQCVIAGVLVLALPVEGRLFNSLKTIHNANKIKQSQIIMKSHYQMNLVIYKQRSVKFTILTKLFFNPHVIFKVVLTIYRILK